MEFPGHSLGSEKDVKNERNSNNLGSKVGACGSRFIVSAVVFGAVLMLGRRVHAVCRYVHQ